LLEWNGSYAISESFRNRLARIAGTKACLKVFGAGGDTGHCYAGNRHWQDEIRDFETQLRVQLPVEYTQILTEIGSGVGPYYGLVSPSAVLKEISDLNRHLISRGRAAASPAKPVPLTQSDANEIQKRANAGDVGPWIGTPWFCDGCIPICFQGCTFWAVPITSGELYGTVWDTNEGDWLPAHPPAGIVIDRRSKYTALPPLPAPPTFLGWYESWLERVEFDLSEDQLLDSGESTNIH
jgi:hypothetical protein